MTDSDWIEEARDFWDDQADTFDQESDHGLKDPLVREAWKGLLKGWLPTNGKVLDIGCGTGSLSILLAELGHEVTGIDLSPAMISQATKKAAAFGKDISYQVMEASNPKFSGRSFDGILCRHLLWSLPRRSKVLEKWVSLLKPEGGLILIEGHWHTGGGLHADDIIEALPSSLKNISIRRLSHRPAFWGAKVEDERYAITAIMR